MKLGRVVLLSLCVSCAVFAQFDSGQISGFVRDETGAIVPGATVTATNEGTGESRKATANSDGYYVFPQLVVGKYSVSVESPGFKRFVKSGVVLDAAAKVSVDVGLQVGAVSEQVTVQAAAVQVQTDSAHVGSTIENAQI